MRAKEAAPSRPPLLFGGLLLPGGLLISALGIAGGQLDPGLPPMLSAYLGHVRLEDTYWYLTATPELLRAASTRFVPDGVVGGAP